MSECTHQWVANSGIGGPPEFRLNRQISGHPLMRVRCVKCRSRTWMTEVSWNGHTTAESLRDAVSEGSEKTCLTDGSPVTEDHRDLKDNGQQKGYVVLCPEERAKGYVRPYRTSYKHLECGGTTTMGSSLAETYARKPEFYKGTFCVHCAKHFPLSQFVWDGTDITVGT